MPIGVYIRTESARIAYSKAFKGRVPWNKGIKTGPQSVELIEARREWMKGNSHSTGIVRDDDFKKKVSIGMKGRKCTQDHCNHLSQAKTGEKNPNWKGGLESNKDHVRERNLTHRHKRMSILKSCGGNFTAKEWRELKRKYNYTCPECGKKEPKIKLTVDHIIPISKGGNSFISNIQPLCGICNCKKFNRESEAICKQLYL